MTDFIRDPDGSLSSTRIGGLLCAVTACGIAMAGMWLNREQAGTVAALLGGSVGSFAFRRKSVVEDPG